MHDKIKNILAETEKLTAKSLDEVEQLRIRLLSKKGEISQLFEEFKTLPKEEKKTLGQVLNQLKGATQDKIAELKKEVANNITISHDLDLSLPGSILKQGSRHPITQVRNEIIDIFTRLGFTVSEGPEIEDDWHVFSALNFPPEHPARDMQDTFLLKRIQMFCFVRILHRFRFV